MNSLREFLQTTHHRHTTARQQVWDALQHAPQPLYIHELVKQCSTINRSSLYRTLELFVELGIVTVVHTGWKKRYELAGPFKPHHHHLQCEQCSELTAIDTPELEKLIEELSQQHTFHITSHHFELRGICHKCKNILK